MAPIRPLLSSGAGQPQASPFPQQATHDPASLSVLANSCHVEETQGAPFGAAGAPHSLCWARGTPLRASRPARPLRPGKGARAPAGSPAAADFIRAVAADGPAGGCVYQREGRSPRPPPPGRPPPPPRQQKGRERLRGRGRPGVNPRKAERRGTGKGKREGAGGGEESPSRLPRRGAVRGASVPASVKWGFGSRRSGRSG